MATKRCTIEYTEPENHWPPCPACLARALSRWQWQRSLQLILSIYLLQKPAEALLRCQRWLVRSMRYGCMLHHAPSSSRRILGRSDCVNDETQPQEQSN